MRRFTTWSAWGIATKILFTFLGLTVVGMSIVGYMAISNMKALGNYALTSSTALGENAILDSTNQMTKLGENMILQKSQDVAKQVEMYLSAHPGMSLEEMRQDNELRRIAVQPVGTTGYTAMVNSRDFSVIIHKYPEQEKSLTPFKDSLPTFWSILESSAGGKASSGYYEWREVDGSITKKYASIVPIETNDGLALSLWATTYITEFSQVVGETVRHINASISGSSNYINDYLSDMQRAFLIALALLLIIFSGLALYLSRVITRPIKDLKHGAEVIGQGNLDFQLKVRSKDELGNLARSFNKMAADLKSHTDELKRTADENIAKERKIQENLRLYLQKVSQAQEAERKRIARELHDDTAQALVVVSRHLNDLELNKPRASIEMIREEVHKILDGVRHYSQELRPYVLDNLGLIPAIKWLASDLAKNLDITVEAEITGNQRQLPPETELTLFRITQEALSNVRKHSQATRVDIKVAFLENSAKVSIQDNGKGFAVPSKIEDFASTGKLGLVGMQERAQLLGGSLAVQSYPHKGTELALEIPI